MYKFLTALFCGLLLCGRMWADTPPHWFEVKTEHFTVLTDSSDKQARHVAGQLERMHALFARMLPRATSDAGSEIVVLALKNRKEMQAVEPVAYLSKNSLDLAGLFQQGPDRSYILLRLDSSDETHPYATVYHEYTHYIVRHASFLPIWLNEGMAQFFQYADIYEKDAHFGEADRNEILFLQQQRIIPLPVLFAVDHNSPYYHDEDRGSVFYAESWALKHYLRVQDFQNKTLHLQDYTKYLLQGEDPVRAGEHAFGDLHKLQQALESYIQQGSFSMFTMPLQSNVDEGSMQVNPIPATDADAFRAAVLAEEGRTADASSLLKAVLAEAPGSADAHESMGLLQLRDGNLQEAQQSFGEAVKLHATGYLPYYEFGALSLQLGRDDIAAGNSLREALKLNPGYAPAAAALAQVDAKQGQMEEASAMILRAVELEPDNVQYRINSAWIHERQQDYFNAVGILKAAAKIAKTPAEKTEVQERLDQVERYQQQLAEAKTREADRPSTAEQPSNHGLPAGQGEVTDMQGHRLNHPTAQVIAGHAFPAGPATGPKHTVKGVMHNVSCFYPKGVTLDVGAAKPVSLYSNDMYSVEYSAANFTPSKVLNPCKEFEGMHASVVYAEVQDNTVAGQILSIELAR